MFSVLSDEHQPAAKEIGVYFLNCMGDKQRLDYGSGHELNFVMFL
jgi:serine/threonine-protein phosphatase 2A activator